MDYLGIFRFVLAVWVAAFHIWTPLFPDVGRHAVMGFFAISGFLITKIATETYRDRPVAFLINRALRIYPTYWACLLFTLAVAARSERVIAATPWLSGAWPDNISGWLTNILIYPMGSDTHAILQAWSLAIELKFYLVIGLATYRSVALTAIGFAVCLGWGLYGMFNVASFPFYFSAMGVGFAFFAGSLAYFASKRVEIPSYLVAASLLIYAVATFGLPRLVTLQDYSGPVPHLFLLVSVACMFVMLTALPSFGPAPARIKRLSKQMGSWSYPVFLLHLTAAIPIVAKFGPNRPLAFFGSIAISVALSLALVKAETGVERLRNYVRGDRPRQTPSPDKFGEDERQVGLGQPDELTDPSARSVAPA